MIWIRSDLQESDSIIQTVNGCAVDGQASPGRGLQSLVSNGIPEMDVLFALWLEYEAGLKRKSSIKGVSEQSKCLFLRDKFVKYPEN